MKYIKLDLNSATFATFVTFTSSITSTQTPYIKEILHAVLTSSYSSEPKELQIINDPSLAYNYSSSVHRNSKALKPSIH